MGTSDYQLGYQAYFNREAFDDSRTPKWQEGWLDAEEDDLNGADFDAYDDFGD